MQNNPTPEERERMVADAMKNLNAAPPSPEEQLVAQLDTISMNIALRVRQAIASDGFVRDRKTMMRNVASLYADGLSGMSKDELLYLLSAFLAGHMLAELP